MLLSSEYRSARLMRSSGVSCLTVVNLCANVVSGMPPLEARVNRASASGTAKSLRSPTREMVITLIRKLRKCPALAALVVSGGLFRSFALKWWYGGVVKNEDYLSLP